MSKYKLSWKTAYLGVFHNTVDGEEELRTQLLALDKLGFDVVVERVADGD